MFPAEYNKIIREHFDISDTNTRKCIVALEDAEQNQLLSALTNTLYDKIVDKVDKIDFSTIPNSRGDITKVDGYENTVECLNIIRKIVLEYRENPDVVDTVLTAIENIKSRKSIFMKAYSLNIEFPIILYNLIVMAIEQSVSFLISVCIQYIKDPVTQNMSAALDKVAYNNTKDNLLYEQLYSFNQSCSSGEMDKTLNDIIKNGGKVHEDSESILFDTERDDHSSRISPFQKFDDEYSSGVICPGGEPRYNSRQVVNGSGDVECDDNDSCTMQEGIVPMIVGIGAATVIGLRTIKFLLHCMVPLLRYITYFIINSRVKFSDTLAVQAQFIEANAYKLQYSTVDIDDNKKSKIISKQLKVAEKLKVFANKIAIDNKKAEKEAREMLKNDDKKIKIDDIQDELSPDIVAKSVLF